MDAAAGALGVGDLDDGVDFGIDEVGPVVGVGPVGDGDDDGARVGGVAGLGFGGVAGGHAVAVAGDGEGDVVEVVGHYEEFGVDGEFLAAVEFDVVEAFDAGGAPGGGVGSEGGCGDVVVVGVEEGFGILGEGGADAGVGCEEGGEDSKRMPEQLAGFGRRTAQRADQRQFRLGACPRMFPFCHSDESRNPEMRMVSGFRCSPE